MKAPALTLCALACLLAAKGARADKAAAQQLFDSAIQDIEAGHPEAACPKFAASQAADPKVTTLLNLGSCYESTGKLASAWASFREAEGMARRNNRPELETKARTSADALAPRLHRLVIRAKGTPGLRVSRDGTELQPAELGLGIPVDEGDHLVKAEASGRTPWETHVTVQGADAVVDVPELALVPVPLPAEQPRPGVVEQRQTWTPLRKAGVVVAGVGVATLAAGVIAGLVANGNYDDARAGCATGTTNCTAGAVDDAESARSLATAGTVLGLAGTVLAAAGLGIVLLAPSRTTRVVGGVGTLSIARSW